MVKLEVVVHINTDKENEAELTDALNELLRELAAKGVVEDVDDGGWYYEAPYAR